MPHLIFTLDFHELVRGNLQPGAACQIDYDPQRIFSAVTGYRLGDAAWPVTAHLRYLPSEHKEEILLSSPAGLVKQVITEPDGQGSMLRSNISVPADTEELEVWFSAKTPSGEVLYDSDFGANYHFRFVQNDLQLQESRVVNQPASPWAGLQIRIAARLSVEKVLIRYRILNGDQPYYEHVYYLQHAQPDIWSTENVQIPYDAVIVFDIIYFVGGKKYKNDNNGKYFLCEVTGAPVAI